MRRPSACNARSAAGVLSLIGSATAISPGCPPVDRKEHDGGAVESQLFGVAGARHDVGAGFMHQRGIAERKRRGPRRARLTPSPVTDSKSSAVPSAKFPATRLVHDRLGERMLAALLEAGREPQHRVGIETAVALRRMKGRSALGEVPVLSTTSVSMPRRRSIASASRNSTPACAARPVATMIDIGVASPERAGAGDDQHRHRVHDGIGPGRLRPENAPAEEGGERHGQHGQHEPEAHLVGEALHRCTRTLRLRDQLHDLCEHRGGSDLLGTHDQRAHAVQGGADDLGSRPLFDRHRLAGQHRFVDAGAPLEHFAVHRHLFPRAHAHAVADVHMRERDVLLGTVLAQAARGLRRQAEQRLQRGRGARARLQLEDLAEQRERDDDRGGFEIHGHAAVHAEGIREQCRAPAVATTL
jgi:hypothetical protein